MASPASYCFYPPPLPEDNNSSGRMHAPHAGPRIVRLCGGGRARAPFSDASLAVLLLSASRAATFCPRRRGSLSGSVPAPRAALPPVRRAHTAPYTKQLCRLCVERTAGACVSSTWGSPGPSSRRSRRASYSTECAEHVLDGLVPWVPWSASKHRLHSRAASSVGGSRAPPPSRLRAFLFSTDAGDLRRPPVLVACQQH